MRRADGTSLSGWDRITWDDDDNRVAEHVTQRQVDGTERLGTGTYGYDFAGRMTSAKHPFEEETVPYALDDAGNIVTETDSRYVYANNKLMSRQALPAGPTSTYGHDHFGNQATETTGTATTSTTYDAASHSRRVTSPDGSWVEYAYDGHDRMVRRHASTGEVTLFFHDQGSTEIALEADGAGTVKTRYLLDADGEPVGNETVGSGGRGWYVEDPRGNLTQLLDGAGGVKGVFAYDPFGKEKAALTSKATGWDSRLRFQMAPKDPKTGMYSLGPRLLDPSINRFVGADHYVAAAANLELALDPLTGNRYLYAGANPANLIDDGHGPRKCRGWGCWARRIGKAAAVVGGVAGAVACGASVVCGVAVGVAAGAASYAASNAGTNSFRWSGLATEGAVGGTLGRLGVAGLGRAAASRALAAPRALPGGRMLRIHFGRQTHPLDVFGNRSHWQVNVWKRGLKDSQRVMRIPVWRSF